MNTWKWCLQNEKGKLLTGWQQDNGKWYFLNPNGTMIINTWKQDSKKKWFYLGATGKMVTNKWEQDSTKKWFYLGATGEMLTNVSKIIDGKNYTFNDDGSMQENNYLISDKLVNFIKAFEGFSSVPYNDGTGVITIGYGTINKNYTYVSEVQATQLLKENINQKATEIKANLISHNVSLTQCQFDAIVSLAYNIGVGGLLSSTLYNRIIYGIRDTTLKSNFLSWSKAGGSTIQGLLNRRNEEYNMFMNGDYTRNI